MMLSDHHLLLGKTTGRTSWLYVERMFHVINIQATPVFMVSIKTCYQHRSVINDTKQSIRRYPV